MNRNSTLAAPPPRPPTRRGQATRLRLVEAAEVVFGEKGFERASIADITRQAGVALGTFYVYFADKQALLVEVVDGLGARLKAELAAAIGGLDDRLEVEREGLRAFFAFTARHRQLYRVVRQSEFVDEACFQRYYRGFAAPYTQALRAAQRKGQVRPLDPEALAYALMGMADFLGMRFVLWGKGKDMEQVLDTAAALVRHGMAAPGHGGDPAAAGPARRHATPARARATARAPRRAAPGRAP
ncbi:MAG: TetR/AcrR family transcriptional regulator [Anaeromyxobacter sp.]|nr:TetR/AcrR family transcriptional regulator [Anaeromyxobacter sp.]